MSMMNDGWRASGLLMHPTSLPTPYGVGDLGPSAHRMAAFIEKAGFHFWQILPSAPTSPGLGNSPYSAYSAFAGNSLWISPDLMVRDNWISADEALAARLPASGPVRYEQVERNKSGLFDLAFGRAENKLESLAAFQDFCWNNGSWLNDYALFAAAKNRFGQNTWSQWPEDLARRDDGALRRWGTDLARPILREKFIQFLFFSQLSELRNLLRSKGLGLIGDAAIYVNYDSSDVWAQPWLFKLGPDRAPTAVAGVPPDYFAKDGQLWGNPLFDWPVHKDSAFDWWKNRLWYSLGLFDWLRLDHFRAFAAYWEVPAGAKTAAGGTWRPGPGEALFEAASERGGLNIIAEDLGIITPDVTALRRRYGYPGMRVLQFGFGPDVGSTTHAPYRIEADNVVYSATHDNNTTKGWFRTEADAVVQKNLSDFCGYEVTAENAAWALIRQAWLSPGALAVTPVQDILNLDENSRLNTPGTAVGNWAWRLADAESLNERLAAKLAELGALAGRDNRAHPNTLTY
ncbi:4-alpha-glucanotransferase [Deltaproteobacteria bacterium OttesenSCG-928-K17]|nr:4-alpha-glucanotransferase [Deltaproteobacteria bacterium OttesenSCG-928-K17]